MAIPAIVDILSKYKATGLYPDERDGAVATWTTMVDHVQQAVREAGADTPRGAVIDAIQSDPAMIALLRRLGIQLDRPDRPDRLDPPMMFKTIKQCHSEVYRLRERIRKTTEAVTQLKDPKHPKTAAVIKQLEKSCGVTIDSLIQQKESLLAEHEAALTDLMTDPQLTAEVNLLDKYEKMWNDCNQEIGEDNQSKGASLEQSVSCITKMISERLGYPVDTEVAVHLNVDWNDGLGEVDLVLVYPGNCMIIVECKSRTHDIMDGWLQSGPERAQRKTHLNLNGTWTEIPRETEMFVVTVLPQHEFMMPFESLVKRVMTYHIKHNCTPIESWKYGEGFFRDRQVPLKWYLTEGYNHVLLLDN